jgi:RNA polymerase sigma-70 factor (ECF subfamily)
VARYWSDVYSLLQRLSGKTHDAEDLAQETFLRAFERRESFTPGTNLRAWLMRIAANAFVDLRRRQRVARPAELVDGTMEAPPAAAGPMEQGELKASLDAAIGELPETPRMVFLLRARQEMSFREIAAMLGTSEENARWHMMQARRQLLGRLKGMI